MTPEHGRAMVARRKFKSGAVTGFWNVPQTLYVVQSYGPHWPLAFWTVEDGWGINESRYHRPTTRRQAAKVAQALTTAGVRPTAYYVDQMIRAIDTHTVIPRQTDVNTVKPVNKQRDFFEVSA